MEDERKLAGCARSRLDGVMDGEATSDAPFQLISMLFEPRKFAFITKFSTSIVYFSLMCSQVIGFVFISSEET
jgi:hypothetical protein